MVKIAMSMAVYNGFDMLTEVTIPSILAQTLTDWKLFIVFDGPTEENTRIYKWLKSLNDKRIDFFHTKRIFPDGAFPIGSPEWNVLGYNAVNDGLKMLRVMNPECKYIAHIDSDDAWHPIHLETLVQTLDSGTCDVVYSKARHYAGDHLNQILGFGEFSKQRLRDANFIAHSSIGYKINSIHDYFYSGDTSRPSDWAHLLTFEGDFKCTELETCFYFQKSSVNFAKEEYKRLTN